jgi:hypothetical protein
MDCEHVDCCGFYRKFKSRKSPFWESMVNRYCEGDSLCARRIIFNVKRVFPADDLMPVGVHASKAFLSLP